MSRKLTLDFIKTKTNNSKCNQIKSLNLWGNELEDISILSNLPSLEIASLSVNKIKSLEVFKGLKNLKELYLRKNIIEDIKEIENLKNLENLKILSLVDNPVVSLPNYRKKVLEILPNLIKLDDILVKNENSNNIKSKNSNDKITVNKNKKEEEKENLNEDNSKKNDKEKKNKEEISNNNNNNKNENKNISIRTKKGSIGGFKKYSSSKKEMDNMNNNLGEKNLLQSMNFQNEFNRSHYRKKIVGKSFQTDNSPNKLIQSQVIIHSKYFEDEKDKGSSSEEKNLLNQYKTEIRNNNLNLGRTMNNTPYVKKNTVNNNEAVFQSIKILLSTLNRPYLLEVQNELNKLLGK